MNVATKVRLQIRELAVGDRTGHRGDSTRKVVRIHVKDASTRRVIHDNRGIRVHEIINKPRKLPRMNLAVPLTDDVGNLTKSSNPMTGKLHASRGHSRHGIPRHHITKLDVVVVSRDVEQRPTAKALDELRTEVIEPLALKVNLNLRIPARAIRAEIARVKPRIGNLVELRRDGEPTVIIAEMSNEDRHGCILTETKCYSNPK